MNSLRIIIFIAISIFVFATNGNSQSWNTLGGNFITSSEYLGSDLSSTAPLRIKTSTNYPIHFYINNSTNPTMSLNLNGDLDITNPTSRYSINNNSILWHNGIIRNIYLGVGAGNSNLTHSNTFIGYNTGLNAGNTITCLNAGSRNTFVGHSAGALNNQGKENSFFGDSCGYNTLGTCSTGYHNTFIGASSGFSNIQGKSNTFIGFESGYGCLGDYNTITGRAAGRASTGTDNCFYGKDAGQSITGDANCYFGSHSGDDAQWGFYNSVYGDGAGRYFGNTSGINDRNCFFGFQSGAGDGLIQISGINNSFFGASTGRGSGFSGLPITNLNYSGAFGYGALVNTDYKIIIGSNSFYVDGSFHPVNVGIGLSDDVFFGGPQSKLEINSNPITTNYQTTGTYGSGLQFRQLRSTTTLTAANYISPYGKVLTVDGTGIVKLTDDLNSIGLGLCPNLPSLSGDVGLFMRHYRIYYDGVDRSDRNFDMKDAIGIGYSCSSPLPGKLSVDQSYLTKDVNVETVAGYFHNGDFTNEATNAIIKRSIYSICDGFASNGHSSSGWNLKNIAGDFESSNSEVVNIAIRGLAGNNTEPIENINVGGWFKCRNAESDNIAVYAVTGGGGAGVNYGIYAEAPLGTCSNGTICSDAAGFFNGDVFTNTAYFVSDSILKYNVQPIQNGMSIINALNPKKYSYRVNQFPYFNLPNGYQDGLIAQEVKSILPELVKSFKLPPREDSLGNFDTTGTSNSYLAVNYIQIIPYIISAIKEQQNNIDSLRNQLNLIQIQLNNCCQIGSFNSNINSNLTTEDTNFKRISIDLSNINTIILDQNSPNPFSEETIIHYSIPIEILNAEILIFDNEGKVLRKVNLKNRGDGDLHIYAEKLSSGIYSYSLVIDGQTMYTKQMVYQK